MGKLISKNTSKLFCPSAERTNEIQGRKETKQMEVPEHWRKTFKTYFKFNWEKIQPNNKEANTIEDQTIITSK